MSNFRTAGKKEVSKLQIKLTGAKNRKKGLKQEPTMPRSKNTCPTRPDCDRKRAVTQSETIDTAKQIILQHHYWLLVD